MRKFLGFWQGVIFIFMMVIVLKCLNLSALSIVEFIAILMLGVNVVVEAVFLWWDRENQ